MAMKRILTVLSSISSRRYQSIAESDDPEIAEADVYDLAEEEVPRVTIQNLLYSCGTHTHMLCQGCVSPSRPMAEWVKVPCTNYKYMKQWS